MISLTPNPYIKLVLESEYIYILSPNLIAFLILCGGLDAWPIKPEFHEMMVVCFRVEGYPGVWHFTARI